MKNKVFISTVAFGKMDLFEIYTLASKQGLSLEFSSNVKHDISNIELFKKFKYQKLIHNYFPPPKEPFVINLASRNNSILKLSIEHCKKNIERSAEGNMPFYAAHAGFCIDPDPKMLGSKFKIDYSSIDKLYNREVFLETLYDLNEYAKLFGIFFLIENNVVIKSNYVNNTNPLLCCQASEIIEVIDNFKNQNIGLLLDTGHLKVSCNTLGLDLNQEFEKLKNYIFAFHHSDNDAKSDSNSKIIKNYWFFNYAKEFKDNIHVIEVKGDSLDLIKEQVKLFSINGIK